jgi:sucrose-phosphate synthase
MRIMHVALQGCLKSGGIDYGLTPDTGGHIRYVLELCRANERAGVEEQIIVTRGFDDPALGNAYALEEERLSERTRILRIFGRSRNYLNKEDITHETGELLRDLIRIIGTLPERPDIIHAHYSDAATLARGVRSRFGIPFVFTAHSLGLVKGAAIGAMSADLQRRCEVERQAIASADRVITSSRDEAEHQVALYEGHRPERVVLNPPGCDLEGFRLPEEGDGEDEAVDARLSRFLNDPAKPPILALARPVHKKNLCGLLHAFGQDPVLREKANLVIFAGVREDIEELDREGRDVVAELFYLLDKYDLWGRVALPKRHEPVDVPAIYRWAGARGGVFCNPALNEPFGLTLLEAAASGLPVVATNRGGPTDIIGRLKNGRLVDPRDPEDISSALLDLLDDGSAWQEARQNGLERVPYFDWNRHARDYLRDLAQLLSPKAPPLHTAVARQRLIVSDIDDTLVGEKKSLEAFSRWKAANKGFHFAIATGRSLQDAISILREWDAPPPEILITSVGSEIYYAHDLELRSLSRDLGWEEHIGEAWNADDIQGLLSNVEGLALQPPCEQRRFKRSYFTAHPAVASEVRRLLMKNSIRATIIHSHERYLDVLPPRASKGRALAHVARKLNVPLRSTIAAGDSGNDVDLLTTAGTGVVVGNHRPELNRLRQHKSAYFARRPYAGGILEALARERP